MVYSTRQFVLCLTLCYFVLVFFSPFSIAITSRGEERANLSASILHKSIAGRYRPVVVADGPITARYRFI